MKVIISLMGDAGDLVAAEPTARLVRRLHPQADLYWVTARQHASLLRFNPSIDAVAELGCLGEWNTFQHSIADTLYDLNLNGTVCSHCGVRFAKRGSDHGVNSENSHDHGTRLAALLKGAGLPEVADQPKFWSQPTGLQVDTRLLGRRTVVCQLRSSDVDRNWTDSNWIALAQWLRAQGFTPVALDEKAVELPGFVPLGMEETQNVACAMRSALAFVGVDSAAAQLANALSLPSVVLLGVHERRDRSFPFTGDFHARSVVVRPDAGVNPAIAAAIPLDKVVMGFRRLKGQVHA